MFLSSLSKIRTVGGVQRKLRQIKRDKVETSFLQWCESEGRKKMFSLAAKEEKKKQQQQQQQQHLPKPFSIQQEECNATDAFQKMLSPRSQQQQDTNTLSVEMVLSDTDNESEEIEEDEDPMEW